MVLATHSYVSRGPIGMSHDPVTVFELLVGRVQWHWRTKNRGLPKAESGHSLQLPRVPEWAVFLEQDAGRD